MKFHYFTLLIAITSLQACTSNTDKSKPVTQAAQDANSEPITQLSYFEVNTYKHDVSAFTEGLMFKNNQLIESTGKPQEQVQDSKILTYDLQSNTVKDTGIGLAAKYFGEGSLILNGKIYWLTWKDGICFVYDESTKKQIKTLNYQGEGWGLTTDGKSIIMSDGTNIIKYLNPETFAVEKTLNVTYQDIALSQINELELVDNFLYANVWEQKIIVKIDINSGKVVGILDLSALVDKETLINPNIDVLNGIAYNPEKKTFYVTGKYWSNIYEIGLK